jgi:intraflagellar transport protein 88
MTGKEHSRSGKITATSRVGQSFGETQNKFGGAHDRLREAQTKLKEKNLLDKAKSDPEMKIQKTEQDINAMINDSNIAWQSGRPSEALEKAKEACTKMTLLEKYLDKTDLKEFVNSELQFSVCLNLASMFEKSELWQEALAEYSKLNNGRASENQFLVRINMGNIYFKQAKFPMAIKMYKMALDMTPQKFSALKFKIMKNIGHAYVQLNEFAEAAGIYEEVISKFPDLETAFNLTLCFYSLGEKDKLKRNFSEMLNIETFWSLSKAELAEEDNETMGQNDPLVSDLMMRKTQAVKFVSDAAKLISSVIEPTVEEGYEWVIEALKNSKYHDVQSEMEISKALVYVKSSKINEAVSLLKAFEKKNRKVMTHAATNLSFIHILEQDYQNAEKYCDLALTYDRYNSKALVNKGNCFYCKRDFIRAKENYLEAIGVEADCIEALYNLAFVNKQISAYGEAMTALEKLQTIAINLPEVQFQIASIYELQGDNKNAIKWYDLLLTKVPNDPNLHAKLGFLYYLENDESQAYHHYYESFRELPCNLDTIAWLGINHVRNLNYERACFFFERASLIQPKDAKWKLMIASCQRRMENFEKALKLYEEIHSEDPENLESLKFIVQICQELNRPCENYVAKLKKLERSLEAMEGGFMEFQNQQMEGNHSHLHKTPADLAPHHQKPSSRFTN